MRYGSVCSGIEAASVAWEPLGWEPQWFSEIEAFPSAVLAHHWPEVVNHGDMLGLPGKVERGDIAAPDILVGGTPCQAFSVAGRRGSLSDERGALTLAYVELANAIDVRRKADGLGESVIVWENVPGVLNTKDNAFGCFLGALAGESCELQPAGKRWTNAGCVFGPQRTVAWRILDAQYFGVAQRRRRVFVVASARDGFDPCAVLFESEGVRRDTPPSREAGQEAAGTLASRTGAGGFPGTDEACSGYVQPVAQPFTVANCLTARTAKGMNSTLDEGQTPVVCVHGTQDPCVSNDHAHALGRNNGQENAVMAPAIGWSEELTASVELQGTIQRGGNGGRHDGVMQPDMRVRRLTPKEAERLQGFPDNHTAIPWSGKPVSQCPDGHRYKAIGNSMAVPVMRWIGERIQAAPVIVKG